jgi:hypothetical protein
MAAMGISPKIKIQENIHMKGYKSVLFFALALAIAVANMFGFSEFQFSKEQADIFAVVVPLIGLVLRYLTTSAIFKAE